MSCICASRNPQLRRACTGGESTVLLSCSVFRSTNTNNVLHNVVLEQLLACLLIATTFQSYLLTTELTKHIKGQGSDRTGTHES